ncbi:MAG: glutathione S-transferase family protein [Pseudomonadota bacterium]
MTLQLYGHPFSSYTWKALIPFYETGTPFEFRNISGDQHPENEAAFLAHWQVGKFPLLVDDGVPVMESSIIVEYVAPGLIPADKDAAHEVRMLDRIFDSHVMTPAQAVVAEHLPFLTPKPDEARVVRAREALGKVYRWLDARLAGRVWAAGDYFTLADCAAAPSLFYADWVHEIPASLATLRAYRAHVLARPSVARCVEEARPYRHYFPLGAPDRD